MLITYITLISLLYFTGLPKTAELRPLEGMRMCPYMLIPSLLGNPGLPQGKKEEEKKVFELPGFRDEAKEEGDS